MKKSMLLSVCAGILLLSCGLGLPNDVLPKDKMQAVLWDVAQGGEFVNGFVYYKYPELNRAAVNQSVLKQIFALHKITKKEFDKSLEYYQSKPDVFVTMLDSISSRQNREKNKALQPADSANAAQKVPPPITPKPIQ